MYKVIKTFTDLQDDNNKYEVGGVYPRDGYTPDKGRIAELSSSLNRQGVPLIEKIDSEESKKTSDEPIEEKPKRTRKHTDIND